MIVVKGYDRNGHRLVEDLGPGVARIQGRNGSALSGSYVVTIVKQAQHRSLEKPRYTVDPSRRCGVQMPNAHELCGRRMNHADSHRTAEAVKRDTERRKAAYYAK